MAGTPSPPRPRSRRRALVPETHSPPLQRCEALCLVLQAAASVRIPQVQLLRGLLRTCQACERAGLISRSRRAAPRRSRLSPEPGLIQGSSAIAASARCCAGWSWPANNDTKPCRPLCQLLSLALQLTINTPLRRLRHTPRIAVYLSTWYPNRRLSPHATVICATIGRRIRHFATAPPCLFVRLSERAPIFLSCSWLSACASTAADLARGGARQQRR